MIERQRSVVAQLAHFAHEYLIWLLVGSYAIAAVVPGFGLLLRDVSLGEMNVFIRARKSRCQRYCSPCSC